MKNTRLQKYLLGAAATLALASSVSLADTNSPIRQLLVAPTGTNTGGCAQGNQVQAAMGPTNNWQNWFVNFGGTGGNGITNYTICFDTNTVPPTGATGGSVMNSWTYDGTNAGGGATYMDALDNNFWGGATFNAQLYSNLEFDFKYDTNSTILPTTAAQVFFTIDSHLGGGGSGGSGLQSFANNGANATNFDGAWHHVNIPIPTSIAQVGVSKGPGWTWFNGAGTSGTFTFWLANVAMDFNTTPPPPPTVSFVPAVLGLNLWNDKSPNYTRHQVRTDTLGDFNVDWVGHTPVTYTWNYSHAPTNNGAGVNFAITPDPATGIGYADPDWSSTNCLYLAINEVGGTSVVANVTMKTNQAVGNSTATSVARLTNNTPTAAGTWSLTFTNDTDFVLTGPGGTNVAATIPANFLTTPYTGVSIFLSATPNNDNNYGSYASVTSFDVTGVATPIHENFVTQGAVNSPFLLLQDQTYGFVPTNTAPNMVFITSNAWNWFVWNLPDPGFSPVVRPNLNSGAWADSPLTNIALFGTNRYTLISKAYQQASAQQYFGLIKRQYSQLQVILPGETNAPGTVTGKTGSPTPVSIGAGGLETFTVNAVDSSFHIIPGITDTIQILSTDGTASLPANAALANGTQTFQIVFGQTGSFTVTATNVSNVAIANGVSSSVTVGP